MSTVSRHPRLGVVRIPISENFVGSCMTDIWISSYRNNPLTHSTPFHSIAFLLSETNTYALSHIHAYSRPLTHSLICSLRHSFTYTLWYSKSLTSTLTHILTTHTCPLITQSLYRNVDVKYYISVKSLIRYPTWCRTTSPLQSVIGDSVFKLSPDNAHHRRQTELLPLCVWCLFFLMQ
jgi:hypothetical protein